MAERFGLELVACHLPTVPKRICAAAAFPAGPAAYRFGASVATRLS